MTIYKVIESKINVHVKAIKYNAYESTFKVTKRIDCVILVQKPETVLHRKGQRTQHAPSQHSSKSVLGK